MDYEVTQLIYNQKADLDKAKELVNNPDAYADMGEEAIKRFFNSVNNKPEFTKLAASYPTGAVGLLTDTLNEMVPEPMRSMPNGTNTFPLRNSKQTSIGIAGMIAIHT